MVVIHGRSRRTISGSLYKKNRSKRLYETGNRPTLTRLGKAKTKTVRTRASGRKTRLLLAEIANVYDPKAKKMEKVKIRTILENPANRQYVRRNIMTKGTVIDTEKGKARITNRPGQENRINAVLI